MNSRTASNWLSASRSNSRRARGRLSRSTSDSRLVSGGAGRPGTGYSCSPDTRSAMRVVTRHARFGQRRRRSATIEPAATTCSKLSRTSSIRCSPMWSASVSTAGRLRLSATPSTRAIVGGHEGRVADRFEGHEPDPVREFVGCGRRDLQREPGLAGAAGSGQAQQPGPGQQRHGLAELLVAADERRELGRQVVRPGVQRPQRREVVRHALDDELGDALRGAQVLEPMLPEVAEGDAIGQRSGDEAPGLIAEQDLATVGDRGDPRRPVDGIPDDVRAGRFDVARVEAHPDADHDAIGPRLGGHRSLRVGGGHDRIGRARGRSRRRSRLRCPARSRRARRRPPGPAPGDVRGCRDTVPCRARSRGASSPRCR